MRTKFENEQRRAAVEAEVDDFIRLQYNLRKLELLRELYEINDQLRRIK